MPTSREPGRHDDGVRIVRCSDTAIRCGSSLDRLRLSREARRILRGHDVACWCLLDQPCHAGGLLEVPNRWPPAARGR